MIKNKISTLLLAAYLLAGCSSGGGTSGAGGAGAVTAGEFLVTAGLAPNGSISVDTVISVCTEGEGDAEDVLEPLQTTVLGTLTITATDVADLTGGIFPSGLVLSSYRVDFIGASPGAPGLTS